MIFSLKNVPFGLGHSPAVEEVDESMQFKGLFSPGWTIPQIAHPSSTTLQGMQS
jgi:hypothetical protein